MYPVPLWKRLKNQQIESIIGFLYSNLLETSVPSDYLEYGRN